MKEELGGLGTERRRAETALFDAMGALGMVEAMHVADGEALEAVRGALPAVARVVEAAARRMASGMELGVGDGAGVGEGAGGRGGGRLIYCGAGTSGRLGVLDASECVPTFGVPAGMVVGLIAGGDRALREAVEGAEDDWAAGAAVVRGEGAGSLMPGVGAQDVLVGIAASGRTPWVLGAMEAARAAGALTVGLSCVAGSPVERAGALAVTVETGPEVVTGSTRLKAGTATKLVLNMISTGVMARLGYVHGNLMVNVQPTNAKLRDRAARIVGEMCGVPAGEARVLLEAAGGEVKTATVMRLRGVGVEEARARLAGAGGVLRGALMD